MEKDKSLIIWLPDGQTMKFEKVTNFKRDLEEGEIGFSYLGVSTGVRRSAAFWEAKIAGFALEE